VYTEPADIEALRRKWEMQGGSRSFMTMWIFVAGYYLAAALHLANLSTFDTEN
jgi:hypothetical protein